MSTDLVMLETVCRVEQVKLALLTTHNGFPVLNTAGNIIGLVSKQVLVTLLKEKKFYN